MVNTKITFANGQELVADFYDLELTFHRMTTLSAAIRWTHSSVVLIVFGDQAKEIESLAENEMS